MNMKSRCLTAALGLFVTSAFAGHEVMDDKKTVVEPDLFRAGEIQLDVFAVYATGNVDFHDDPSTVKVFSTRTETRTRLVTTNTITTVTIPSPPTVNLPPLTTTVVTPHTEAVQETVTKTKTKKIHIHDRDYTHNAFGAGVGVNYFITRNFGLGLEGDWIAGDSTINSVAGSFIYRCPFENEAHTFGWAPYAFIGGGGQFDGQNVGFGFAGGGTEVRFSRSCAVFADGRYVLHDSTINYGLFRLGCRVIF
jgi:hypothetical protein